MVVPKAMGLRFFAMSLLVVAATSTLAQATSNHIILLQSFRTAMPINNQFYAGISEGLDLPVNQTVEINIENLDLPRIDDEQYVQKLVDVYKVKYRSSPPNLVIATYTPALRLLLNHRRELFPDVPIVFCSAELSSEEINKLPPDVTGVTSKADYSGTVELMARLHPDIRQIALIVGSSHLDKLSEQVARKALKPLENRFQFIWLRGLPIHELTESVKALPSRTAILYVVQYGDRDGVPYVPWKVVQAVSKAASVPVYGLWETLMGSGIVGGRLLPIERQSVAAGKIARRIILGEAPAAIPVVRMEQNDVIVDARQLERWGIDQRSLPENSRILYRKHSLWEQHRSAILISGGVMVLQALWIVALVRHRRKLQRAHVSLGQEHAQRMQAEKLTGKLQTRLGAEEKQSILGALAGRIAHEINQPLIAIQNYSKAARRYLPASSANEGKLAELLAEMEGEADRAGNIIRKIRSLLSSEEVDAIPVDIDKVLKEALTVMKADADAYACHIDYRVATQNTSVLADALQIQLVMVNLLRNAIEAMTTYHSEGDRLVSITISDAVDSMVEVSVADTGPGVPSDEIEDIFESLYTTKESGMGVGLATCRTIIVAHGGRIWYTPNPVGGANFHFTLPAAKAGD